MTRKILEPAIYSWNLSLSHFILFLFWINLVTIRCDDHLTQGKDGSQVKGSDVIVLPKDKRSVEYVSDNNKEFGDGSFKRRSSFVPTRGKKDELYQQDSFVDQEGVYGDEKRAGFMPMRGKKDEEIAKKSFFSLKDEKSPDDSNTLSVEDKRSFFTSMDNGDSKRAFYAMRGKKDFDNLQDEDKRAFYAMRGKKDEDFDEDKRAFYAMRGKKDDLKRAFYAMRGKKDIYDDLDEDKRAFYAMRGKKDDLKRAFYAMRGKKGLEDLDKRAFYAMRGKKDYYDENKRAFYAMRGKKNVDDFVDAMRHAYVQDEEMNDMKRTSFLPMRGKRSVHSSEIKNTV